MQDRQIVVRSAWWSRLLLLCAPSACRQAPPVQSTEPTATVVMPSAEAGGSEPRHAKRATRASEQSSEPEHPLRHVERGRMFSAPPGQALQRTALAIACQEREPCHLIAERDAGTDADGRALSVMEVSLSEAGRDPMDGDRIFGECVRLEHWLMVRQEGKLVEAELLLELCNDGYGAAGVGEDVVEVAPNTLSHTRFGGSAWRWSSTITLQLVPRRVIASEESGFWAAGRNTGSQSWNWETFSGSETAYSPPCKADGMPPTMATEFDALPEEYRAIPGWLRIPVVDVDATFSAHAWKTAHLGACAAKVGIDASAGFVLQGKHAGSADSTLKVVGLTDGSFVVEITDDQFVLQAADRPFEDHLEVWSAQGSVAEYTEHCQSEPKIQPRQWSVRLTDGEVFSGVGEPLPGRLRVMVGLRDAAIRLRLWFLDPAPLVTFAYSDSDDGQNQKALIATSAPIRGQVHTLGTTLRIDPRAAVCKTIAGKLEPVVK